MAKKTAPRIGASLKVLDQAPGLKLKVQYAPLSRFKVYANNPKDHPEEQIRAIMASMEEFGFYQPVLISAKDDVIAGHGRLEAATRLGEKVVPYIVLDHLTPAQERALRIADNSIPEKGSWNPDMLRLELDALRSIGFDMAPLGLEEIPLPALPGTFTEDPGPKTPRTKSTLFVSVKVEAAERARRLIIATLDKANIEHNL